ncbi:hypothetical protein AB0881_41230, partial [Spirillospora sp. NPDC029432]
AAAPAPAPAPVPEPPAVPGVPAGPPAPEEPREGPAGRGPVFVSGGPGIASGTPLQAPHGTRLWHWDGTGDEAETAVPVAVFDAIGGMWTQVRADAVPAPRRD